MSVLFSRTIIGVSAVLLLAACGGGRDEIVDVAVIGDPGSTFARGARLPTAAQLLRGATVEGLVALDQQGRVIPALADRWTVYDNGQSFIFRLRDGTWPDGSALTAESARLALQQAIAGVNGTPLALDLGGIAEIRAMAGRVIEIRLSQPVPELLQLLAQPELGLTRAGRGIGPMTLTRDGRLAVLRPLPPEDRGLPGEDDWAERVRNVHLRAMPAAAALQRLEQGKAQLVLGGQIEDLPRIDSSGLSRGGIRVDPVAGLFGLVFTHAEGLLKNPQHREAIAMAIDRDALAAPFGLGGWAGSTRIVPAGLVGDTGEIGERWEQLSLGERQAQAAARIARWQASQKAPAVVRIALPDGPGGDLLYARFETDLKAIGLQARRVGLPAPADLRLVDAVARYSSPFWYFNQLSCTSNRGLCNSAVDRQVALARAASSAALQAELLAEAEAKLTVANIYVPIGPPVRWSMLSGDATGFAPNRWGVHPLMPLAMRPK